MRILTALTAAALVAALAGCSSDESATDDPGTTETSTPAETEGAETEESETSEPAAEGPVPGAGVGLKPGSAKWCEAITPEQLTSVSAETDEIMHFGGGGLTACSASMPGSEFGVEWGSEPMKGSLEDYAAQWAKPAGVFEQSETTLANGQAAVVALQEVPVAVRVGTVVDGRLVEATIVRITADEATSEELVEIGQHIVSVYVD